MRRSRYGVAAWDHNAWYHAAVLRRLPPRLDDVLEVGCGAGGFAARLAGRAAHVDALDRDPVLLAAARARVPDTVTVRLADVTDVDLPPAHYGAVTAVSVLHHLDLPTVLPRLAAALAPGGVLVATGLPQIDLPRELPYEAAGALAHRALGAAFGAEERWTGRTPRYAPEATHELMTVVPPRLTLREVRRQSTAALPGARVRRLVLWRYLLVWRRPGGPT